MVIKALALTNLLAVVGVESTNGEDGAQPITSEPNTDMAWNPWAILMIATYVLGVHCLAAMSAYKGWCWIFHTPLKQPRERKPRAVWFLRETTATSSQQEANEETIPMEICSEEKTAKELWGEGVKARSRYRTEAEGVVASFKVDQLKDLCRSRQLPTSGNKNQLVERILGSTSRATDKQMYHISNFLDSNHNLKTKPRDIDSTVAAASWITAAAIGEKQDPWLYA